MQLEDGEGVIYINKEEVRSQDSSFNWFQPSSVSEHVKQCWTESWKQHMCHVKQHALFPHLEYDL